MSALVAALCLTAIVLFCWHFGRLIEWYMASDYSWPVIRRLAYMLLALAMLRGLIGIFL